MKSCRRGFIRCKRREEPCGSHHVEAKALKWDTSAGLTDDVELCRICWALRRSRERFLSAVERVAILVLERNCGG